MKLSELFEGVFPLYEAISLTHEHDIIVETFDEWFKQSWKYALTQNRNSLENPQNIVNTFRKYINNTQKQIDTRFEYIKQKYDIKSVKFANLDANTLAQLYVGNSILGDSSSYNIRLNGGYLIRIGNIVVTFIKEYMAEHKNVAFNKEIYTIIFNNITSSNMYHSAISDMAASVIHELVHKQQFGGLYKNLPTAARDETAGENYEKRQRASKESYLSIKDLYLNKNQSKIWKKIKEIGETKYYYTEKFEVGAFAHDYALDIIKGIKQIAQSEGIKSIQDQEKYVIDNITPDNIRTIFDKLQTYYSRTLSKDDPKQFKAFKKLFSKTYVELMNYGQYLRKKYNIALKIKTTLPKDLTIIKKEVKSVINQELKKPENDMDTNSKQVIDKFYDRFSDYYYMNFRDRDHFFNMPEFPENADMDAIKKHVDTYYKLTVYKPMIKYIMNMNMVGETFKQTIIDSKISRQFVKQHKNFIKTIIFKIIQQAFENDGYEYEESDIDKIINKQLPNLQ